MILIFRAFSLRVIYFLCIEYPAKEHVIRKINIKSLDGDENNANHGVVIYKHFQQQKIILWFFK